MSVCVLFLSLIVGCSAGSSSITTKSHNENAPGIDGKGSKSLRCDDLKGYSIEEGTIPDTHHVNIVKDGVVLHTIKLPTGVEHNGFAFNWAKKTKEGFEIAIEYGSRIYYSKRFNFICRHHKFYLNKIRVDSFDRHNPAKWSKKVTRVQPNLPLEKFSVTAFMREQIAPK